MNGYKHGNDSTKTEPTEVQRQHFAEELGKPGDEVYRDELSHYRLPRVGADGRGRARTLYDALAEKGRIDHFDGPPPPSRNKKPMEGFGKDHE